MPLHLLGKKSWNVYNADNVARVRQDEAAAQAKEEAEEQRTQEEDAARRLRILRGQSVSPIRENVRIREASAPQDDKSRDIGPATGHPKRRKLRGENDTDMEMRLARETDKRPPPALIKSNDAPITDTRGHINLFPDADTKAERKERPKRSRSKDKREAPADEGAMKFVDAAGFRTNIKAKPWYHDSTADAGEGKDVWGNADAGRQARNSARVATDDPLAAIKRGVQGVRAVERERRAWTAERERDLPKDSRRRRRHHEHKEHRSKSRSKIIP